MEILERKASDLFTYVDKFSTVLGNNDEFNEGLGAERSDNLWDAVRATEYTLPRLAHAAKPTSSESE